MAITSRFGLWRVRSLKALSKYNVEKSGAGGFWVQTPMGKFHCTGLEAGLQFDPTWEVEVQKEVMACKGLFLDIGSNIGFYSVMAARNGNPVIAVEPNAWVFGHFLDTLEANELTDRVERYNVAAWSESGKIPFEIHHADTGKVNLKRATGLTVGCVTIDSILLGRIPFLIKIDAEGAEPRILKGMSRTLASQPRIVFEALSQEAFRRCAKLLTGYTIRKLDRTNYLAT